MSELHEKARNSKKETKQIEFKCGFDPASKGEWCEIIKDVVAIANSGGGIIVFGVNDDGSLSSLPLDAIGRIDLADLSNKITKYTGCVDPLVEIQDVEREEHQLPTFMILPAASLLVFGIEGAYVDGTGRQKNAFGKGTVYFRHGAKSEPGTTEDIRSAFHRQLNQIRNSWLKQVKRVVRAPAGSQLLIQAPIDQPVPVQLGAVSVVNAPGSIPVTLTRDPGKSGGTFLHEEVSEGIFDEINNVVDANRILAKGQARFFLGQSIYYRVYAERGFVKQSPDQIEMLFHAGASEFYAPNLFWAAQLDAEVIAHQFAAVYLEPKGLQIHWLMRIALLLGGDFCRWLYGMWDQKWHHYSQPPFAEMVKNVGAGDLRLLASRETSSARVFVPGQPDATCSELLSDSRRAEELLSAACIKVFEGDSKLRSAARVLDYFAHGLAIVGRAAEIAEAAKTAIGGRTPGDFKE
jgi:hypothetical protein